MFIHPTSIVETENIGKNVHIGPFCYIAERVVIGDGCKILGHASIGTPSQYKTARFEDAGNPIIIGARTEIREFVTINLPTYGTTSIGEDCFLMANVHIPHDCEAGNGVIFVVGAAIGGRAKIGNHCYFGLNSSVHNKSELGDHCVVGADSFFKGRSPSGIIWAGVPSRPIKANRIGIERNAPKELQKKILMDAENFLAGYKNK